MNANISDISESLIILIFQNAIYHDSILVSDAFVTTFEPRSNRPATNGILSITDANLRYLQLVSSYYNFDQTNLRDKLRGSKDAFDFC